MFGNENSIFLVVDNKHIRVNKSFKVIREHKFE